jgi:hypothetical protein
VIHFRPVFSFASCDEHQLTLQVTKFIEVVEHLEHLIFWEVQLHKNNVMDVLWQLGLTGNADLVDPMSQYIPHLSI